MEDLKAWLQDHNGDNWDADNDEGKMHKVRLEEDVCGDGSQHEMAVWRYKDPAPTGCSAHIAQGLIDLAVSAAGDATSDSGDVLDIITSGDCLYLSWKRNETKFEVLQSRSWLKGLPHLRICAKPKRLLNFKLREGSFPSLVLVVLMI